MRSLSLSLGTLCSLSPSSRVKVLVLNVFTHKTTKVLYRFSPHRFQVAPRIHTQISSTSKTLLKSNRIELVVVAKKGVSFRASERGATGRLYSPPVSQLYLQGALKNCLIQSRCPRQGSACIVTRRLPSPRAKVGVCVCFPPISRRVRVLCVRFF